MTSTENLNDKPRAVFAPDDYAIILRALKEYFYYFEGILEDDELSKVGQLIHRLGRITNE